ncbi:hypothetical protein ACWDE9_01335 [Streptomyces olivaceoviridis]
MTNNLPERMLRAFSRLRLGRYVSAARGNALAARRLYWWNVEASAALYGLVPAPPDSMVAELSFGFWASLVSGGSGYDRLFWVPTVHKAFPHYSGRRDTLYDGLWSLVLLRNRIMHHEPIHHRDLAADHAKIYRMLGYLDPQLAKEAQAMDRFPAVLAGKADTLRGSRPSRF